MTTESYSSVEILMKYYGNSTKRGAQIPFNFGLFGIVRHNVGESMDKCIKSWLDNLPENTVPNWVVRILNVDRTNDMYVGSTTKKNVALFINRP